MASGAAIAGGDAGVSTLLAEYYESGNAPHEALGRAARRLSSGGALYLGGGVGVEKVRKQNGESFAVTSGGKPESFEGPLSAVVRAFTLAGSSTSADSPGGATAVADPAAAARLRELKDEEAEAEADIRRYETRLERRKRQQSAGRGLPWSPGVESDDAWEARRIEELKADLGRIRAERSRLLATGQVTEAEVGKPGTNWKQVGAGAKKKLSGILAHYRKSATPFRDCVADNTKRFGPEGAKKVCAVVKDLNQRSTKWRKGGKTAEAEAEELIAGALARLAVVEGEFGLAALVQLAEGIDSPVTQVQQLAEAVTDDFALLALAGHPLAEAVFGVEEAFSSGSSATRDARSNLSSSERKRERSARHDARVKATTAKDGDFEKKHPRGKEGTSEGGRFVRSGSSGDDVKAVQDKVGAKQDGEYGEKTRAAVMDFQRKHGLVVDGIVGHQTAVQLAGGDGKSAKAGDLKGSDREKLKRLGESRKKKPRGRAPERRARGGIVV